jgi:hypothetical protein
VIETTYSRLYWVKITVKPKQGLDAIEHLIWKDLPFEVRTKFDWYFKYRAAKLQVKYPKMYVHIDFGSDNADAKTRQHSLKNLITKRKAQVTEWQGKINKAKKHWTSLFPIEDDIYYKRALAKLEKAEFELKELETEFNNLK